MTTQAQSEQTNCPLCDKQGLLLFPAYYALARSDEGKAPELAKPFKSDLSLPDSAHFTLRLPRTSYLYVYDEARKQLTGHTVSPSGYLTPFDPYTQAPPAAVDKEFSEACTRKGDPYAARCVAVKKPKEATKVWLGLSDTPWTKAVCDKHCDAAYRKTHMRCVDVGQWLSSQGADQPHATKLEKLGDQVAEYVHGANTPLKSSLKLDRLKKKLGPDAAKVWQQGAFGFSVNAFHVQRPVVAWELAGWASNQCAPNRPMLVGIDDPAGLAMDLNGLAMQVTAEWMNGDTERKWEVTTSKTIESLRRVVEKQAVEHERQERISAVDSKYHLLPATAVTARDHTSEIVEVNREIASHVAEIGQAYWQKHYIEDAGFGKIYNESQRQADDEAFHTALEAFDKQHVTPLSRAYLTLIATDAFKTHFTHNHDPNDVNSGMDYVQLAQLCAQDACGRADVQNAFKGFLALDPAKRENIWVRAFILDQDTASAQLEQAVAEPSEGQVPWAKIAQHINLAFTSVVAEGISNNAQFKGVLGTLSRYVYQVAGPVLSRLGEPLDDALTWGAMKLPEKRLMTILSWISQTESSEQQLVFVSSDSNSAQRARIVSKIVAEVSNGSVAAATGSIINDAAYMPPDTGEKAGTKEPFRFATLVNGEVAEDVEQRRAQRAAEKRQATKEAIATNKQAIEQLRQLDPNNLNGGEKAKQALLRDANKRLQSLQAALKKGDGLTSPIVEVSASDMDDIVRSGIRGIVNADFRIGVVGLIFAGWSLYAGLDEKVKEGTGWSRTRYGIAAFGAFGGLVEVVGAGLQGTTYGAKTLQRSLEHTLLRAGTRAELVAGVGRIMGAVAGLVLGVWQFGTGISQLGQNLSLGLYNVAIGGLTGIVSGLLLFGALTGGLAFILFVAVAAIAFIGSFFVDNKFQAWLRKSYYGTAFEATKFTSLVEQHQALEDKLGQKQPVEKTA